MKLPVFLLCLLPWFAQAESMACGNRWVNIGDPKSRVQQLCGEPDSRDTVSEVQQFVQTEPYRIQQIAVTLERWTYYRGSNRFIHYLIFQNGDLFRIQTGSKP